MIVAHQDTAGLLRELLAVNPFAPARCKPLRGFGGVTARLSRAREAAMSFKAIPTRFNHKGWKSY